MTGWRVGYIAAPARLLEHMRKVHQYTIMSAPTISQYAALAALREGEPYVQEMVAEYDRRRHLIVKGLNEIGLSCFEPQGAFYAFPSILASGMDDTEFAECLLQEERVARRAWQRLRTIRRRLCALLLRDSLREDRGCVGTAAPVHETARIGGHRPAAARPATQPVEKAACRL